MVASTRHPAPGNQPGGRRPASKRHQALYFRRARGIWQGAM